MHLYCTDYDFEHIYDMKRLKEYMDYAERDIKRCEEAILKIRDYQRRLFDHAQVVINTDKRYVVTLNRQENYSSKKVEYYVSVEHRPITEKDQVKGRLIYGEFMDSEKFGGTQRHEAIKYANELSKKYRAPIEKKGRWSK